MLLTREQIINYIYSFPRCKWDIIKDYCLDSNKGKSDTELFIYCIQRYNIESSMRGKPLDLGMELARYILDNKLIEYKIIFLRDNNNTILKIY